MMMTDPGSMWDVPPADSAESPATAPIAPAMPPAPVERATRTSTDVLGGVRITAPAPAGAPWPTTDTPCPDKDAPLTWVSTHGGAGSTSLAALTTPGVALTRAWPGTGWPQSIVLVARSNAAGLAAAAEAIARVASGQMPTGCTVRALVLVADAPGRLPRDLRRRVDDLAALVPALIRVEWVEAWRTNPYTVAAAPARQLRSITKEHH